MKVSTRQAASGRSRAERATSSSHRPFDIAGVVLISLAIITVISLSTPDSGLIGRTLGEIIRAMFGRGAWIVAVLSTIIGAAFIRGRSVSVTHLTWGLLLMYVSVLGMLAHPMGGDGLIDYLHANVSAEGGYLGGFVGGVFGTLLGLGKIVGLGALTTIGFVLCIDIPIRTLLLTTKTAATQLRTRPLGAAKTSVDPKLKAPKKALVAMDDEDDVPVRPDPAPADSLKTKAAPVIRDMTQSGAPVTATLTTDAAVPKEGYQLPPMNLLAEAILAPKRSQAEMQKNIETLEGTLEQFGIDANVVEVATGPTVTRYEIQLGPGVRVQKITALADNIAMDLAASQVRVEAPIPGKSAIGVEVPNVIPSPVTLKELCEAKEFVNHPSRLFVALGKDVSGVSKYADLTKMPHLLIGGATNSGKSIGLATIITSLLMRNTPKDCRLVMIDPKRVELTLFDHIPHLMCPVVKDVKEAPGVLRAVWREMDRRYDLFSEAAVRNIDGWNSKATFQDKLPYIVVIIDELADLMIQAAAEVETSIVRLAQLARAVGIHLVIATQRPSVDVITGTIKANIPSRIAFSVASQIDSRTIIDAKGAENLIGKGDMLFLPIDANKPVRVQGCYVSEREIEAVCNYWRAQEKPMYVLDPVENAVHDTGREGGNFGEELDPFWEDAVRWVVDRGQASTSMLQRKFSIGFQRASRLLDMMEERAIVGPRDGPRPRDVLINPIEVDELFGGKKRPDLFDENDG